MQCNYGLTINGKEILFRSQADLNEFLYNHREQLKGKTDGYIKFSFDFTSDYIPQQETLARLSTVVIKGKREIRRTLKTED